MIVLAKVTPNLIYHLKLYWVSIKNVILILSSWSFILVNKTRQSNLINIHYLIHTTLRQLKLNFLVKISISINFFGSSTLVYGWAQKSDPPETR
jgi:hypothetical protein